MNNNIKNKILIVDDNSNNIKIISIILRQENYTIVKAYNGQMALEYLEQESELPDLILLDIMMPIKDGFETCIELKNKEKTKDIPVIFMSALVDIHEKIKALNIGGVDYITKPFHSGEVLARINVHLTLNNLRQTVAKQNQELTKAIAEKEEAIKKLQATQFQLIHNEKMSSLSQMVAGIAHEINNPINFIYGNIRHAREYLQYIFGLLELYEETYPEPSEEITEEIEAIELSFLKEDFVKVLESMQVGTNRIRSLVESLRNFSRLDEAEVKQVDIHDGIDSTLMILQSKLNDNLHNSQINIIKDYGELPLVECYPGQLNQVFLSILDNAIDTLDNLLNTSELNSQNSLKINPQIIIKTEVYEPELITISISDNGQGISDNILSKIFEPFFTTKPIGKGTGLGLSIAHSIIVEQHKGELSCISQLGKGTEFIIKIPINLNLGFE